jgi:hypothetical protein
MTSDHIYFIYLEPINRKFRLYDLVIIVHVPDGHSAFFIKHCPILTYLPSWDFAIFITSEL